MYRVLVLGGQGMLGQMINHLLSRSNQLVVKHTCRQKQSNTHAYYYDVDQGVSALRQIFEEFGPFDYLINCIGILNNKIDEQHTQSLRKAIVVNALFPHELADLAQKTDTRVIHISTDGVFAQNAGVCLESSQRNCTDVYGKTKRLGEVTAPNCLTIRCSIIGINPTKKQGLLEWFRTLPMKAEVKGFTNHIWNGVTTLQFAQLCRELILEGLFDTVRNEAPLHHFCPNQIISKFELLQLFQAEFRPDVTVKPAESSEVPICRILDTHYLSIRNVFGYDRSMQLAIENLAAVDLT